MKTLDLVLKHKWYDMIESGEKPEEYRERKSYWVKRIERHYYTHVRFHRGYTSTTMTYEIKHISEGVGRIEWGAPDEVVYIIKLGVRIE